MTRRRISLLMALLCLIASASVNAVSQPVIIGSVAGYEVCPQEWCGQALFVGEFIGSVNGKPTAGKFFVAISHEPLGPTAAITSGTWNIRTKGRDFAGTVTGGMLTDIGDEKFSVLVTLDISKGGNGTLTFNGELDHDPAIPTIVGPVSQ